MSSEFLQQALVYLTAAVVFVPLIKKTGLSSVLGYLIAGIAIGPFLLGFVGSEGEDIMHAAEFGVVMMLFLIGLELEPAKFWAMRKAIVGLGVGQMAGTTLILFAVFMLMLNWPWQMSLAVGMALSMSSTAIVLQNLKEKNLSRTVAGEASFSVLLFQDIAVIPILAFIPFLALENIGVTDGGGHGSNIIEHLPGWQKGLIVLGAIITIIAAGRFLIVPLLRYVSRSGLKELFTASALLLVIAVAYLMQLVGLSPALGTFLAGVVLATTEFRHELETDVDPFKGLLLGLFFISVGSTIDLQLIVSEPMMITALVLGIVIIKTLVLIVVGKVFRISMDQNFIFAFGLGQVGEFAFVILSFTNTLQIIDADWNNRLMAVTAISMMLTPLLLLLNERLIAPYFGVKAEEDEREDDAIAEHNKVIIAGFGHFGSTIGRLLRANNIKATILDHNSDRVELLRQMGLEVYYGDATRKELLESAGIEEAKLLIAAIDDFESNMELAKICKKHYPNLKVMIRAKNRYDAYDMIEEGVEYIYRENLHTAVQLGVDALTMLGVRRYTATRLGQKFAHYDTESLKKMASHRKNHTEYVLTAKQEIEWLEKLLQNDLGQNNNATEDHSWDSDLLREVALKYGDPLKE